MSVLSRAGRIARTVVHLLVVHRRVRTCIAILIIVIASIALYESHGEDGFARGKMFGLPASVPVVWTTMMRSEGGAVMDVLILIVTVVAVATNHGQFDHPVKSKPESKDAIYASTGKAWAVSKQFAFHGSQRRISRNLRTSRRRRDRSMRPYRLRRKPILPHHSPTAAEGYYKTSVDAMV